MKLIDLAGPAAQAHATKEVTGLSFDSRNVQPGFVFFAIRGHSQDGHRHIPDVLKKNPAALVVEDSKQVPAEFKGAVFITKNARAELDTWASRFYGRPADKLFCIGVTGTNGKTTSVYMLERIFNAAGRATGVLGTIDHHLDGRVWPTSLTTPDAITLQARLNEFLQLGAQAAAFEVSSIALDQDRVSSIPFDAALFTNFTRDHLDYHGSMEKYFAAKAKLFEQLLARSTKKNAFAVLNADDPEIRKVRSSAAKTVWFGESQGEYKFEIKAQSLSGSRFQVKGHEFSVATPGRHNVYNAAGALAVAFEAGISAAKIHAALEGFSGAPGRLEAVPNGRGLHVFVDYAHTDDALRSVLLSLRRLMRDSGAKGKLWTVFGCGGDRDKGKRPLMTRAALESSDQVVLTSDNPRTEDPGAIISDCLVGVPEDSVITQIDRKTAIATALQSAKEGDVILIAGKGHEDYQIIGQTKYPFSDVAVVRELLA